jgi:hypothetical protein
MLQSYEQFVGVFVSPPPDPPSMFLEIYFCFITLTIQGNLKSVPIYDPRLKPSCKTKPEGFSDPFCYNFHHPRLMVIKLNSALYVIVICLQTLSMIKIRIAA